MRRKHLFSSFILILALGGCQGENESFTTDSSKTTAVKPLTELIGSQNAISIRQGSFEAAERPTSGKVEVAQAGEISHIVLGADFQSYKGPDLQVVLHQAKDLQSELSPPNFPLKESEYVVLGKLKSLNGQQTYRVPAAVNIERYGSVAIWCEKFNATFGTANLRN